MMPKPAPTNGEWLTLEQASKRLGVHATTLRRWADDGAIEVFLTPGGHRRFSTGAIERFQREHYRSRLPAAPDQQWADHAIAQTRMEIPSQRWVAPYTESERETQRLLGRRIIGLALQYMARSDEGKEVLSEARIIGTQHARNALLHGQTLSDLLQAISFFRVTLLEVALLEMPHTMAGQPEANRRLLRRIERLVSEVQSGVVDYYLYGGDVWGSE